MQFESEIDGEVFRVHLDEGEQKADVNGSGLDYQIIHQNNGRLLFRTGTKLYKIDNVSVNGRRVSFSIDGTFMEAVVKDDHDLLLEKLGFSDSVEASAGALEAPMPGKILEILIEEGQKVEMGQPVLILEAMKMENELKAPIEGTVGSLIVKQGDNVEKNQILLEIEPRG